MTILVAGILYVHINVISQKESRETGEAIDDRSFQQEGQQKLFDNRSDIL